jgi:IS5 family transposase
MKNGIMVKAVKGKPLTRWQKRFNKLISKKRYIVEQAFGTLKRRFQFHRASYFTTVKVHTQMILKSIAFNLLKALRQVHST